MKHLSNIPSAITMLNLCSGFLSLFLVASGRVFPGVLILILAFFFDLLDGLIARSFGWSSELGVQLDSLADTVSFVIAPAFIIAIVFMEGSLLGIVAGLFVSVFGVLRLAKFNITKDKGYFVGMSTPYFTSIVIGTYLVFFRDKGVFFSEVPQFLLWVCLGYLMVSGVRYPSLKGKEFSRQKYVGSAVLFLVGIFVLVGLPLDVVGIGMQVTMLFLLLLPFSFKVKNWVPWGIFVFAFLGACIYSIVSGRAEAMVGAPMLAAVLLSPLVQLSIEEK